MSYKKVELEQGTPEWLAWRKGGVGSSDIAVLLGLSTYSTPYKLYLGKTQGDQEQIVNDAMAKGHDREKQMRAGYELKSGIDFPPGCFESTLMPHVHVSLDGWAEGIKTGLEMKYVGKDYYDLDGPENIKPDHMAQMQYQMAAMETLDWFYVKTMDGQNFKTIKVEPNISLQDAALAAAGDFWDCIINKTPPPYTDQDYVPVDDPTLRGWITRLFTVPPPSKAETESLRALIGGLVSRTRTEIMLENGKVYRVLKTDAMLKITANKDKA
jgi:putative phage-type endonuclease